MRQARRIGLGGKRRARNEAGHSLGAAAQAIQNVLKVDVAARSLIFLADAWCSRLAALVSRPDIYFVP